MSVFKRRPLKMRTKILVSSILCVLLALGIQTGAFYQSSSRLIYSQTQEITSNNMQNLQDELYSFNKSIENSMIKIYIQNDFMRDLKDGKSVAVLKNSYSQITYDCAKNEFLQAQNVTSLYIYSMDHKCISYYRHAQTPTYQYPADIFSDKEIFDFNSNQITQYVESDERVMLLTSYYNPFRGVNIVRYVLKIYSNGTTPIGYMVCDVDPKTFISLLEKYIYSDEQIMWLQPFGGDVIIQVGKGTLNSEPFSYTSDKVTQGDSLDEIEDKGGYELFSAEERKYNFNAFTLIPQTLLQINQITLLTNTIITAMLIVITSIIIFMFLSNGITKPLTSGLPAFTRCIVFTM